MKKGLLSVLVMLICFSFVVTASAADDAIATTTIKSNAYLHKQPNDSNSDSQGIVKAGTTVEILEEVSGHYQWCVSAHLASFICFPSKSQNLSP